MGKYREDAQELLRLVGGKDNIVAVTHCITRMRFALADPGKADVPAIEALASVRAALRRQASSKSSSVTTSRTSTTTSSPFPE